MNDKKEMEEPGVTAEAEEIDLDERTKG